MSAKPNTRSPEKSRPAIHFDTRQRVFTFCLQTSFYAFGVNDSGRLVHLGSGPLPPGLNGLPSLVSTAQYEEPTAGWDSQMTPFEFPAAGDVTYHETAIRVAFFEPGGSLQAGEVFSGTVRDLRPRYVAHGEDGDFAPGFDPGHGQPTDVCTQRPLLWVLLRDELYDFEIRLFYRLTVEHDIIERWAEVTNRTGKAVQISGLDFACMHLPLGVDMAGFVTGAAGREFTPASLQLEQGVFLLDQGGGNTGHAHNPFFFLHAPGRACEEAGPVWFGALRYSGNWSLRFEKLPDGRARVFGGYGTRGFGLMLGPGESHVTPAMVLGCANDGQGGATRRLHRFARERVLPSMGRALRPVLYNSWEATAFDVHESGQIALARKAAAIGVELFCIDDGWFGSRSSDRAGLGDWWPRKDAFPRGLKVVADEVRALGMKFGLWVEPEMVNPDSELYRAHPDWVLHYPSRPRTERRNQLILDFGRPEVVEHLLAALDALVSEVDVDFLKWDMNRYVTEAGSVAGQAVWREHVRGVYRIMDELRRRHPGLEIQTCSGGGGRIDLGILARCDQAWVSDNTDALDRTRIQDGFSLAYPARTMECWVTDEINGATGRMTSLELRFDVAMRGVLGIGSPIDKLESGELDRYKEFIAFYKRIRPVVQEGDLYRLETAARSGISVWLFVAPDRRSAVFSSVVLETPLVKLRGPFVLRGLDPSLTYRISDRTGRVVGEYPGSQLMTLGLPDNHRAEGVGQSVRSRTLLLEAIG